MEEYGVSQELAQFYKDSGPFYYINPDDQETEIIKRKFVIN